MPCRLLQPRTRCVYLDWNKRRVLDFCSCVDRRCTFRKYLRTKCDSLVILHLQASNLKKLGFFFFSPRTLLFVHVLQYRPRSPRCPGLFSYLISSSLNAFSITMPPGISLNSRSIFYINPFPYIANLLTDATLTFSAVRDLMLCSHSFIWRLQEESATQVLESAMSGQGGIRSAKGFSREKNTLILETRLLPRCQWICLEMCLRKKLGAYIASILPSYLIKRRTWDEDIGCEYKSLRNSHSTSQAYVFGGRSSIKDKDPDILGETT